MYYILASFGPRLPTLRHYKHLTFELRVQRSKERSKWRAWEQGSISYSIYHILIKLLIYLMLYTVLVTHFQFQSRLTSDLCGWKLRPLLFDVHRPLGEGV